MDGIDASLVRVESASLIQVLHSRSQPYASGLRESLLTAQASNGETPLREVLRLDALVGLAFADAADKLISDSGVDREALIAIGSHGQTIYHGPCDPLPVTSQIGDPNIIAESVGRPVVADCRRADIAAGGQGAPLASVLHEALFRSGTEDRAVLNLGGIANLTLLPADARRPVIGFDTGPASGLMDDWIGFNRHRRFDRDGAWARSGQVEESLLGRFMNEPYLQQAPPKSTGREYFNLAWLKSWLSGDERPQDVQATLARFTALSIAESLRTNLPDCRRVIACGGGVHNRFLMGLIRKETGVLVEVSDQHGLDADWVEAALFAWLASARLGGVSGNVPSVTGARGGRVLGGLFAPGSGSRAAVAPE